MKLLNYKYLYIYDISTAYHQAVSLDSDKHQWGREKPLQNYSIEHLELCHTTPTPSPPITSPPPIPKRLTTKSEAGNYTKYSFGLLQGQRRHSHYFRCRNLLYTFSEKQKAKHITTEVKTVK